MELSRASNHKTSGAMNWLCCLSPGSQPPGGTGGVELKDFQGVLELRTGGEGAREGDLSAGHGVSQQCPGSESVLGVGQAECFDLSFNSTPEFMLDWEGDGFRLQAFPVLTDHPLGPGHPFLFHVSIQGLLGQEVLRERRALSTACLQKPGWCSGVMAYA